MTSKITEGKLPCPACPSSDAYHLYDDGHGYCFSCKYLYLPNRKEDFLSSEFTYEYLPWRGINAETFRIYDIKTKIDSTGKPLSVGFQYPDFYKIRDLEKKNFHIEGDHKPGLFGKERFPAGSHKYVTITEGELDAASYWQVLRAPVVSVQSSASALRDCTVDRSWLEAFERVYLAFDADEPGREATRAVAKLFDYNKVYDVKFTTRKDANEYVANGEGDALKQIWWNSKKYLPETIISSFSDFEKLLTKKKSWGVPYPFPTLNRMTYGMRTGELVLIKAQEKVGKTALMHHIEHQLLTETDDAIGGLFLEEGEDRHLQALAGLHLKKPVHLPDSDVTEAEIFSAVKEVVRSDDRLHIYSHFGSDDPDVLLDEIRFLVSARLCRWILFDHISMAVTGLQGEDARKALDYLSTRLRMMVKELDFGLIMVSHVNDEGKTRDSRWLTKVADITIDASRDTLHYDPVERCTMRLSIPYNRYCSKTGPAGYLLFDETTYTMSEVANDNEEVQALSEWRVQKVAA